MNVKEQFEQFELLKGKVWYYLHCELIQIFGVRKVDKTKIFNKKLLRINEEVSCGVLQSIFSIEKAINLFDVLYQCNKY